MLDTKDANLKGLQGVRLPRDSLEGKAPGQQTGQWVAGTGDGIFRPGELLRGCCSGGHFPAHSAKLGHRSPAGSVDLGSVGVSHRTHRSAVGVGTGAGAQGGYVGNRYFPLTSCSGNKAH